MDVGSKGLNAENEGLNLISCFGWIEGGIERENKGPNEGFALVSFPLPKTEYELYKQKTDSNML